MVLLGTLLQKELRSFQTITLNHAFLSQGKGLSVWDIKCLRQLQESEKGCLLSIHWLQEILHWLKRFHIHVLNLNIGIKILLYETVLIFGYFRCELDQK